MVKRIWFAVSFDAVILTLLVGVLMVAYTFTRGKVPEGPAKAHGFLESASRGVTQRMGKYCPHKVVPGVSRSTCKQVRGKIQELLRVKMEVAPLHFGKLCTLP